MGDDASQTPMTSDQLPEEAPAEQVLDDVHGAIEGAAREAARRHLALVRERLAAARGEPDGGPGTAGRRPG